MSCNIRPTVCTNRCENNRCVQRGLTALILSQNLWCDIRRDKPRTNLWVSPINIRSRVNIYIRYKIANIWTKQTFLIRSPTVYQHSRQYDVILIYISRLLQRVDYSNVTLLLSFDFSIQCHAAASHFGDIIYCLLSVKHVQRDFIDDSSLVAVAIQNAQWKNTKQLSPMKRF